MVGFQGPFTSSLSRTEMLADFRKRPVGSCEGSCVCVLRGRERVCVCECEREKECMCVIESVYVCV